MENTLSIEVFNGSNQALTELTAALKLPREVLPKDEDIKAVVSELPNLLAKMNEELRDERIVKLCLASGVGLFDAAINYIWVQTVVELRKRVISFGLGILSEIKGKPFDEKKVNDLQDSELLDLCLELTILDDEAYYYLSQCRDMRNNCSVAHPPVGEIDRHELVTYINRCIKYVLSKGKSAVIGVNIQELLSALEVQSFSSDQLGYWKNAISSTNQAQRTSIFKMLHGKYCDPRSSSVTRANILNLSLHCKDEFNDKVKGEIIDTYNDYVSKGEEKKKLVSEDFITKVGFFDSLSTFTRHAIISRLCKQLITVHNGWNNFYNEPPYAEYLAFVSKQSEIPDTVKSEFVDAVVVCATGNYYGVSNGAENSYWSMIKDFSPKEIGIMLRLPNGNIYFGELLRRSSNCNQRYKKLLQLVEHSKPLLTPQMVALYDEIMKQ